jgi:hypothetical protein
VLNVSGQTRLHDAAWVEQLDIHASEVASAKRRRPASADVRLDNVRITAVSRNFIWIISHSIEHANPFLVGEPVRCSSNNLRECRAHDPHFLVLNKTPVSKTL